jgi:hypothetical protein
MYIWDMATFKKMFAELLNQGTKRLSAFLKPSGIPCSFIVMIIFLAGFACRPTPCDAQGTWTPLLNKIPDANGGVMVMLLLSDGTVMAKTDSCKCDSLATSTWVKLTPDIHGSYVNGTWTAVTPMHDSRVYFASQILKDGRVFVAGGEYGTGSPKGEIYDPLTDTWTMAPAQTQPFSDANSEILPDGRVLVGTLTNGGGGKGTLIFDPTKNAWSNGPTCFGNHDESAWVKLPDNSVLFVDMGTTSSERYIPSLNKWVADANVPVALYDAFGFETGAGFLLPDGRAWFLGATGHTAYYAPSGNTNPGIWAAGPDIPSVLGTPDAAAAMMVNGKILCAVSPVPVVSNHFPYPTSFYEFDYLSNAFTKISAPNGADSLNMESYLSNMLDLPDGTVLFSRQDSSQCYIYTPGGVALSAGKPTIKNYMQDQCTYRITGTGFNGISEGAAYGDDWQMASNYPIVRLTAGPDVYYARSSNWNRTGVQTGTMPDTAAFSLPAGMPTGVYSLEVIANGIPSDPISFAVNPCTAGIDELADLSEQSLLVFPNPAAGSVSVTFRSKSGGAYGIQVVDMLGRKLKEEYREANAGENSFALPLNELSAGVYLVILCQGEEQLKTKIVVR